MSTSTAVKNTVFDQSTLLKKELLDGLTAKNKFINPKFFYDEQGSQLFEKIMQLPEYYPTRTEKLLLKKHHDEIALAIGKNKVLIEPGAGNCEKVQYILSSLNPSCYIPIDISADFLFDCTDKLQKKFPNIKMHAIADDMKAEVNIPEAYKNNGKVVFYPGSTIGNYNPHDALDFLEHTKSLVGNNGGLLIGVDLQKDKTILDAAYNDQQGVTAQFNLNALNHANKLLDSEIDVDLFEHVAFYNEEKNRIEMHLECQSTHDCQVGQNEIIGFTAEERIHTEYSYKYTIESFNQLAEKAGLKLQDYWVDDNELFSIQYYTVA